MGRPGPIGTKKRGGGTRRKKEGKCFAYVGLETKSHFTQLGCKRGQAMKRGQGRVRGGKTKRRYWVMRGDREGVWSMEGAIKDPTPVTQ